MQTLRSVRRTATLSACVSASVYACFAMMQNLPHRCPKKASPLLPCTRNFQCTKRCSYIAPSNADICREFPLGDNIRAEISGEMQSQLSAVCPALDLLCQCPLVARA